METDVLPALARAASGGDPLALDRLLAELEPLVVRATRLVVGAGSWEAEDAAQEALLDIARSIGTLREPEAVRTWALRVASARALKHARRERLRLRRRAQLPPELSGRPAEPDERTAALKEEFDRLPPRVRAAAVLRLHAGLSEQETAAVLGCSPGTVKSSVHTARRRLADRLRARGFAPPTLPARPQEVPR
ncbi:MAG TPA: sigma-70 family RNA polymerase sigma factor [Gaiellaceae bacterium]|nr:sigma-70 family RNA polymerase sigma factor [Gaiellaceae bacterium]